MNNIYQDILNMIKQNDTAALRKAIEGQPEAINAYLPNGLTLLCAATIYGREHIVERLLRQKIDISKKILKKHPCAGKNAAHLAAEKNQLNILKLLYQYKPNIIHSTSDEQYTPLIYASKFQSEECVEFLIKKGSLINKAVLTYKRDMGYTAIDYAAYQGNIKLVKLLYENGANLNSTTNTNTHIMHIAASIGSIDLCKYIYEQQPSAIKMPNKEGKTPFHIACSYGHINLIAFFIDNKIDNKIDPSECIYSPGTQHHEKNGVVLAIEGGHFNVFDFLNEYKIPYTYPTQSMNHPIFAAIAHNNIELVELMLQNKPLISNKYNNDGYTPLIYATKYKQLKTVNKLLKYGADIFLGKISSELNHGKTAAHYAAEINHLEILERLYLQNPSIINTLDSNHCTPLLYAAQNNSNDTACFLLNKCSNTAIQASFPPDYAGYSAIHFAAVTQNILLIRLLINANANPNELTQNGEHIIHIAAAHNHKLLIQLLIEGNISLLNETNAQGLTPYLLACQKGQIEAVSCLESLGADKHQIVSNENSQHAGKNGVFLAIENGHIKLLKTLNPRIFELICLGEQNQHPIHIAIINGHAEIVKLLINTFPNLINISDNYQKTPLIYASIKGYPLELIDFLLEKGANVFSASYPENNALPSLTALDYAIYHKHDAVIIQLLNHIYMNYGWNYVANEIVKIKDNLILLQLVHLYPEWKNHIFQDARQKAKYESICSSVSLSGPKLAYLPQLKKRPSFCLEVIENQCHTFKKNKLLGSGSFGTVRAFTNDSDDRSIAVKSPLTIVETNYIASEIQFYEKIYPRNLYPSMYFYYYSGDPTGNNARLIMPVFPGIELNNNKIYTDITSFSDLLYLILSLTQAIQKMHHLQIVHGDIRENNILVNKKSIQPMVPITASDICDAANYYAIYLIDFNYASWFNEPIEVIHSSCSYWAPERCHSSGYNKHKITAHYNQDVYSYAYLLQNIVHQWEDFKTTPKYQPMPHNIKKWIQTAQHASPILRGTLNQLEDLLLQTILINWRNQSGNNIFHWFANHLNQDNVIIGILLFRALLTNPIHFNLLTEPNNEGISAIELLKQQYINRNNLKKIYNKNDLFTLFKNNNQINPVHHIPMNSETESASNIVKSLDTACIL